MAQLPINKSTATRIDRLVFISAIERSYSTWLVMVNSCGADIELVKDPPGECHSHWADRRIRAKPRKPTPGRPVAGGARSNPPGSPPDLQAPAPLRSSGGTEISAPSPARWAGDRAGKNCDCRHP